MEPPKSSQHQPAGELAGLRQRVEELEGAQRSEAMFRAMVENANDIIYTLSTDGTLLYVSPNWTEILGHEPEEVVGRSFVPFVHPDDLERCWAFLERVLTTGEKQRGIEYRVQHKDGHWCWHTSNGFLLQAADGSTIYGGIARDISDRKRYEEQLHTLVAATPVPMIITRVRDGEIMYANEPLAALVGTTSEALTGRRTPDFYLDPDERDRIVGRLAAEGKVVNHEVQFKRLDGTPFWALLSLVATEIGGDAAVIGGVYDIDDRRRMEDRLREALRELESANQSLREAQIQLVQTEKMASLGMLVAGIAHEINTPVGAVSSVHDTLCRAVDRLKEEVQASDRAARLLETIDEANQVIGSGVARVTDIVKRLRSFARLDEAELKEVDLHDGIEDTLALIHHELKNRVTVVRAFGELPKVDCFPRQLNQVFLNLLINASQELEDRGTITITTSAADGHVEVSISDNGRGIAPENLGRVFDPGFTTKGVGVGTGLGLSICYRIIQDHRGQITVESEPGKTTFSIRLPTDLRDRLGVRS